MNRKFDASSCTVLLLLLTSSSTIESFGQRPYDMNLEKTQLKNNPELCKARDSSGDFYMKAAYSCVAVSIRETTENSFFRYRNVFAFVNV